MTYLLIFISFGSLYTMYKTAMVAYYTEFLIKLMLFIAFGWLLIASYKFVRRRWSRVKK